MSAAHNGGPAFPSDELFQGAPVCQQFRGMTLLDYFAGKALPSAYAWALLQEEEDHWTLTAMEAYNMARAMLAERPA